MSYQGAIDILVPAIQKTVKGQLQPDEQVLLCFHDNGDPSNVLDRTQDILPDIPMIAPGRRRTLQERGAMVLLPHRLLIVSENSLSLGGVLGSKYKVVNMAYQDINGVEILDNGLGSFGIFISTPNYPMPSGFNTMANYGNTRVLFGSPGKQDALRFVAEIRERVFKARQVGDTGPIQSTSIANELEKLRQLHISGALTDHEFQKAKEKLLGL